MKTSHGVSDAPHTSRANLPAAPHTARCVWLSLLPTTILFCVSFASSMESNVTLTWSVRGAALLLAVLQLVLLLRLKIDRAHQVMRTLQISLRPQHYVQALVQLSVYVYWGYYWPPIYQHAWFFIAQILFAYAFDMVLTWSRREAYVLGFGPWPIILSTNLFLWFKDDWAYLQFLMIAVGFMGKEFVRWHRDGKSTHIFNPSAFALGLFSLILLVTGTTNLTWGQQIASTLTLAPHIYAFIFATGLIVMYFFSITLIAATATATLLLLTALYATFTGVPYFLDSAIPAAVFLGLHLLVTDPSTSPRAPLGKAMFGALYGCGVFALYGLLTTLGTPTFYDKLLCVPLLNLSVQGIDHMATAISTRLFWQRLKRQRFVWRPATSNLAHMAMWIIFFGAITACGKTDGKHAGDSVPFWQHACTEDLSNACSRLLKIETTYCSDDSAWACNELGIDYVEGKIVAADQDAALKFFSKACELRFTASCLNLLSPDAAQHADPRLLDLRLLLRERGKNLMQMSESDLLARACDHGFAFACKAVAP